MLVASLPHLRRKKDDMSINEEEKRQRKETIAALLHQTAEDHHVAYKETDGVDPDWSIWYSGHLLENGFDKLLDATLLKSDLIYLFPALESPCDSSMGMKARSFLGTGRK